MVSASVGTTDTDTDTKPEAKILTDTDTDTSIGCSLISDIIHYMMKDKVDKADLDKLMEVLLKSRKRLVEARADIDFLAQGVTHERRLIQISPLGGYTLMDRVEGRVQVDQEI